VLNPDHWNGRGSRLGDSLLNLGDYFFAAVRALDYTVLNVNDHKSGLIATG
jgi:hypothetical protein